MAVSGVYILLPWVKIYRYSCQEYIYGYQGYRFDCHMYRYVYVMQSNVGQLQNKHAELFTSSFYIQTNKSIREYAQGLDIHNEAATGRDALCGNNCKANLGKLSPQK